MLIFPLEVAHDFLGAIGTVIVYDQHVEVGMRTEYRANNSLDIFLLVIGGYYDKCFGQAFFFKVGKSTY